MNAFHALLFYGAAFAAVATTLLVLLSQNPVYAVLYLVLSLFSVSLVFYTLGAAFLAVLEVLVYAGAIMVLFLFVVMMLNLGGSNPDEDIRRPARKAFLLPTIFAVLIAFLTMLAIYTGIPGSVGTGIHRLGVKEIGQALYNQHYLGVELVSLILTIGMIGGMHLGRAVTEEGTEPDDSTGEPVEPEPRRLNLPPSSDAAGTDGGAATPAREEVVV